MRTYNLVSPMGIISIGLLLINGRVVHFVVRQFQNLKIIRWVYPEWKGFMKVEDKINTISERLGVLEKEVKMLHSRLSVSQISLSDEIHSNKNCANSILTNRVDLIFENMDGAGI